MMWLILLVRVALSVFCRLLHDRSRRMLDAFLLCMVSQDTSYPRWLARGEVGRQTRDS